MATPMTAAQWRAQLAKWHVDYHLYSGYDGRGRPGTWAPVGIIIHHTGSDSGQSDSYLEFLFVTGRPEDGIPGPLCNVATDMDGDLHLGATGRANHAGSGDQTTLDKVQNPANWEGYNTVIVPGSDDLVGNGYFYGNELRYDGGQPPTAAMYETVVLFCAAVCDFHGWTAERVIGHKEWTARKNDPGNLNMAALRRDVRDALAAGPGNWPEMGDDVALTQAQVDQLAKAGWLADQFAQGAQFEEQLDRLEALLATVNTNAADNHATVNAALVSLNAAVAALQADVDQTQVTAGQIQTAVNGIWATQIGDVETADPNDTISAANHLAYVPKRSSTAVMGQLQPHLDEIKTALADLMAAVTPPEPPAPLA